MENNEIVQNRRNTTIVYVGNHEMRKKSTYNGQGRYVCTDKLKLGCKATGKLVNDVMIMSKEHCHPPDAKRFENEQFKDMLWQEVVTTEDTLRDIWERVAINYPAAGISVTFSSIERQMQRWRRENRPPIPETLNDFSELINSQEWNKYREYANGEFLRVHTIVVDDRISVTIMGDPNFLATLQHVQELYIDATFEICPRQMGIYQFLTIMGRIDDTPTALAWAFMTRKTERAYRAVFEYFRTTLAPGIHPTVVHMDFEPAIRNAIRHSYPDAVIVFCYFHHCQAIYKKLKARGKVFIQRLSRWDLALAFYRKLLGLALLPAADIIRAFNWLIRNTAPDVLEFFGDAFIYDYYQAYWLTAVGPEGFSVYGENDRTSNFIEAYHRVMRTRMGSHPSIWRFMVKLRNYQAIVRIETFSLDRGQAIRRAIRQETVTRRQIFNRMWDLYDQEILTLHRFLSCYNHVSKSFDNDFLLNDPDQVNEFVMMPVHDIGVQLPNQEGEMVIEGIDNIPLPILRRNPAENNFSILVLENIEQSLCQTCHGSVLNVISLPCRHWFLCESCTEAESLAAFEARAHVECRVCRNRCIAFETVQIS